jgi:hypothetical protein
MSRVGVKEFEGRTAPKVREVAESPAILTVSLYRFPDTVDLPLYHSLKGFPRGLELEEAEEL